jgi:N-methylhydantoinase A
VTDADLVLGKLEAAGFAGGSIDLDTEAASSVLVDVIGGALDMQAQEAALGVAEVVDENMANAARVHAVENGEDLSGYTMIAFGGAAPLHAARLCEKLGIERLLVPPGAGVGSAIGFLHAPFSFEATRSLYMTLDAFDAPRIAALLQELRAEATGFVEGCDASADILSDYKVYMRYKGQGWEIPVVLTQPQAEAPVADVFQALFEAEYTKLFGRPVAGLGIEITVWAVNATTPPQPVARVAETSESAPATPAAQVRFCDPAEGAFLDALRYDRDRLGTGHALQGPAKITEAETTIIVPKSRQALRQADGCIDVTKPSGSMAEV